MKRALPALFAVALVVPAAPGLGQGATDPGIKILELEARIDQLTRRVEVLEAQAAAESDPGVRTAKDLVWHFDGYTGESPFKVSQQEFDRKTGQVDLLLNLVAEPADGDLWRAVQTGDALPIEVTATLAGGGTAGPVPFILQRRAGFAVGTHVHVLAQLPVKDPKAVRRLAIGHTGPR